MCPGGAHLDHAGQCRHAGEAESAVHLAITAFLRIAVIRITAVVPILIRKFHVMRGFLTLFHIHVTESSLQRLGADRQDEH